MPKDSDLSLKPLPFALEWHPVISAIREALGAEAGALYLVGGAVRDSLLHRPIKDLDFAVAGDGQPWARRIANRLKGAYHPLDAERGVGRAIIEFEGERFAIDVAQFRGDSLATDLEGRDFTLNAIAAPLQGEMGYLIDPLNGIEDLRAKRLCLCAPDAIRSDPIRALRGVRQGVALKLLMTPETRAAIKTDGVRFVETSPERIRDELMLIMGGARPHVALRTLDMLGLLRLILPEVDAMRGMAQNKHHAFDVLEHTFNVVERLDGVLNVISPGRTDDTAADSALGMIVYALDRFRPMLQAHLAKPLSGGRTVRSLLILGALLHDAGKPATRSVGDDGETHFYQHEAVSAEMARHKGEALRLSTDEVERLAGMVAHHMRPALVDQASGEQVRARSIHRFWRKTGDEVGLDVCLIGQGDYLGKWGPALNVPQWIRRLQVIQSLLDGYFNRREEVVSPPTLVNGTELMHLLRLSPSPEIGRLLRLISEAQAAGEVTNKAEALIYAQAAHEGKVTIEPNEDED